jgi:hypothetical protein
MDAQPSSQMGWPKDALLSELFTMYQEAAAACKAVTDMETKRALADNQTRLESCP